MPPLPPPRHVTGPYTICLVCLGNICRSPMAEVVLRAELAAAGLDDMVTVDSAGTGDWHVGRRIDAGARAELARRGYDGSAHRARQVRPSWLADRDLVLAMDSANLAGLRRIAASAGVPADRIALFGEVAGLGSPGDRAWGPRRPGTGGGTDIPDPYGGGPDTFSVVLDLIETGARRIALQLAELLSGRARG